MPHFKSILLSTVLLSALTGPAFAKALRDEPSIDDNMLKVAIAIEISDECSSISARKLKGLNYLWSLKSDAADLGYSDDEIRSYVESKAEKARIRARGEAYIKAAGYNPTSAQDLCALGTQEIAKQSRIGSFLRTSN
jgi:hypothetical protein